MQQGQNVKDREEDESRWVMTIRSSRVTVRNMPFAVNDIESLQDLSSSV
jgi:hypothetical protein